MGRHGKDKQFISICLHNEIIKSMDIVLDALNQQIKKGEQKYTRSMLINDALCLLFSEGAKLRIRKTKGGKNNA